MNASACDVTDEPLVILVDDVRIFADGRPSVVAQTAAAAITLLTSFAGRRIAELWLDYDLFDATSEPVVDHLEDAAAAGTPVDIGVILVHSSRIVEALAITHRLRAAGYTARREYSAGIWARNPNTVRPRSLRSGHGPVSSVS